MNKKIIAKDTIPLLIAFIIGILIVIPRLLPGIPQGVDSASHLSKILFMFNGMIDSVTFLPGFQIGIVEHLFSYYIHL